MFKEKTNPNMVPGRFTSIPSNLSRLQESAASSKTQKITQAAENTPPSLAEQVACKACNYDKIWLYIPTKVEDKTIDTQRFAYLVVEPTHLKNMPVKLDHFPQIRIKTTILPSCFSCVHF